MYEVNSQHIDSTMEYGVEKKLYIEYYYISIVKKSATQIHFQWIAIEKQWNLGFNKAIKLNFIFPG